MPEVQLTLEWPDGARSLLYSPSTVIQEDLSPGQNLSVAKLREQGTRGLRQTSERVRARYGFACTRADEEERQLLEQAATFRDQERVRISSAQGPGPSDRCEFSSAHAAPARCGGRG